MVYCIALQSFAVNVFAYNLCLCRCILINAADFIGIDVFSEVRLQSAVFKQILVNRAVFQFYFRPGIQRNLIKALVRTALEKEQIVMPVRIKDFASVIYRGNVTAVRIHGKQMITPVGKVQFPVKELQSCTRA